jgi:hypothetical protein
MEAVISQDTEKLRSFFKPDACIYFANTNEKFTRDEYVSANSAYPEKRHYEIEDIGEIIPSDIWEPRGFYMAKVWDDVGNKFYVIGHIEFGNTDNALIQYLVEYWSEPCEPPQWRKNLNIGKRYAY